MNSPAIPSAPVPLGIEVITCPGLSPTGTTWTDSRGRSHDLEAALTLSPSEAAADSRLFGLGYSTADSVTALIRSGHLYPVFKKSSRTVRIFDPALTDFRARCMAARAAAIRR